MANQTSLTDLEHRALIAAIGNIPTASLRDCLMRQVPLLSVISRQDNRPYGFYTYFACLDAASCPGTDEDLNKRPPSAWGIYGPGKAPISFLVYIRSGRIDFIEASTCVSEWPEREDSIEFPAEAQQS